ncbi:1614_t:CDS:2 [Acaulospora colombiana]|uniref:1614_t:CDS:1 n=1 Tax=Acaulospora colombiana TaxID=27376 RepID=A0ACA9K7B4_9GLOM|nr:1614_t:CDS:2 [Acaulospora colombiana]
MNPGIKYATKKLTERGGATNDPVVCVNRYLVVENVPALNLKKELLELFALYGTIEEYRYMDDYLCEEFTDVYWIKFQSIAEARVAKRKADDHVFFGSNLRVRYGPEYESIEDTRQKLDDRRKVIDIKTQERKIEKRLEKKKETQGFSQPSTSATQPASLTPSIHNFPQLEPSAYSYGNYNYAEYYYNYPYATYEAYQSPEPPIPGMDYQSSLSTSFAVTSYQPQHILSDVKFFESSFKFFVSSESFAQSVSLFGEVF